MAQSPSGEDTPAAGSTTELIAQLTKLLQISRNIDSNVFSPRESNPVNDKLSLSDAFNSITRSLATSQYPAEVEALQAAYEKITEKREFGGFAIDANQTALSPTSFEATLFQVEAYLTALNKKDASRQSLPVIATPVPGTKPMNLAEKIFAHHAVGQIPTSGLSSGDVIRVGIDWILASELSWAVRIPSSSTYSFSWLTTNSTWQNNMNKWAHQEYGGTIVSGLLVIMSLTQTMLLLPK